MNPGAVSRNHSGFVLWQWVRPFFSYKVSQGIHSMLNSGITGFCFDSKLRKSSEETFWSPLRKIGDLCKNLCCSVTGTLCKDPTKRALQKSATTGCLELISEISRTVPEWICDFLAPVNLVSMATNRRVLPFYILLLELKLVSHITCIKIYGVERWFIAHHAKSASTVHWGTPLLIRPKILFSQKCTLKLILWLIVFTSK